MNRIIIHVQVHFKIGLNANISKNCVWDFFLKNQTCSTYTPDEQANRVDFDFVEQLELEW